MSKVLILYYSSYGHTERMAQAVAEGVRDACAGSRMPSENELAGARFQGRHVALIAGKLQK